jgi:hypothetical protein
LVLLAVGAQADETALDGLRAKAQERMRQDAAVYSTKDLRALEELYQAANRDMKNAGAKAILERVVKDYPRSNRAGCAVLYLAQFASGPERERLLKDAIENHNDTWYGDGVQVGALARANLALLYAATGRLKEAKELATHVAKHFPDAVDHDGRPLVELLRRGGLF